MNPEFKYSCIDVSFEGKSSNFDCGIQCLELSCLNLCSICKIERAVFRWGLCPIS